MPLLAPVIRIRCINWSPSCLVRELGVGEEPAAFLGVAERVAAALRVGVLLDRQPALVPDPVQRIGDTREVDGSTAERHEHLTPVELPEPPRLADPLVATFARHALEVDV